MKSFGRIPYDKIQKKPADSAGFFDNDNDSSYTNRKDGFLKERSLFVDNLELSVEGIEMSMSV